MGLDPSLAVSGSTAVTNLNPNTGDAARTTGNFTMGSGTWILQATAAHVGSLSIVNNFTSSAGTITFRNSTGTANLSIGGTVAVVSGITQFGSGTGADLLNSVTVTGLTTVASGATLNIHSANAQLNGGLQLSGGTVNIVSGTSDITARSVSTGFLSGTGGTVQVASSGSSVGSLVLYGASGSNNFGGTISNGAAAAVLSLTEASSGIQSLSGANTYSGGTTISAGTLLANNTGGSATGSGAVTVAVGATLGGAGFIAGPTTVNGILSPGNSIGTLTVANDVTWNGAASVDPTTDWKFELGASNTADLLAITGLGSDFLKGTGTVFRFDFQGSAAIGTFVVVDWAGTTNFSSSDFTFTNLGGGHSGSFAFNGSQLEFTAMVPEPSTWGLFGVGLMIVMHFRRRNRAS